MDLPKTEREIHLYLGILENFPALIWRSNLDGLCDYFNKSWLEFTGRTPEQEAGNGWAEGVHPDDLQRCVDYYFDHFRRREPFRMEYRLRRHDGAWRWILDIGQPFWDVDGSFLGYIGSCFDISDQKEMVARLESAAQFQNTVIAIIGHDLRNLVSGMNMALEALGPAAAGRLDPNDTGLIEAMGHSGQGAAALLENLLAWGQNKTGRLPYKPQSCQLGELVRRVAGEQEARAQAKGITLELAYPPGLMVRTDPDILATVLRNLAANAVKFTPAGGRVSLRAAAGEGGAWIVEVLDSGTGMDAERLASVQAGQLVKGARGTAHEPGSGLGLLLVRDLLERLGARLAIESRPGEGSRFRVEGPALPPEPS